MKIVRVLKKETIKKVFEALNESFEKEGKFGNYGISYNLEDFTDFWLNEGDDGFLLAAIENDKVVGGIGGSIIPSNFNKNLKFASELFWFVLKEYRDKDVGKKLYVNFEQWACDKQATNIMMIGLEDLKDVEKFYQANNFSKLETTWIKRVS